MYLYRQKSRVEIEKAFSRLAPPAYSSDLCVDAFARVGRSFKATKLLIFLSFI